MGSARPHLTWVVAVSAMLAWGCATGGRLTPADTARVDRLLQLVKERLDVAPDVARTKWNTRAPIEDLPRERQILDGVAGRAGEYGLDPEVARRFFAAQIEASKVAQNALHAEWTAKGQPPFATVADLGKDIRPVLDRLTPAMMRALADAVPALRQAGSRHVLERRGTVILGEVPGGYATVRAAIAPLRDLAR